MVFTTTAIFDTAMLLIVYSVDVGRRAHKQTWKRVRFKTDELIIFKLTVSRIKTGVTVAKRVGRWSVQLGSGLRACPAHRLHI